MNSVLKTTKKFASQVQDIVMINPLASILVLVVFILAIVIASKKENFEAIVYGASSLAEYPAAFAKKVVDGVSDIAYENYFASEGKKMELPAHTADVKVDIGNGMAVSTKVEIPAQTVVIPTAEATVLPTPTETEVKVAAQTVELPAQTGVIEAKIEGSDKSMTIPVDIPAQTVEVPEQKAVIPVIEPFRM